MQQNNSKTGKLKADIRKLTIIKQLRLENSKLIADNWQL